MSNPTAVSDLERAEHLGYGEGTGVKRVSIYNEDGVSLSANYPLPTDGDSLYVKDIDSANSSVGSFTGTITDIFTSDGAGISDATATDPKNFTVKLKRPVQTGAIGLTAKIGSDFSNVKIYLYDPNDNLIYTFDDSATDTKRTAWCYDFDAVKEFCKFKVEFHTTDAVGIGLCWVKKIRTVAARLQAISETTGLQEDIHSDDNELAMIVRLRNATGNTRINPATEETSQTIAENTNEYAINSVKVDSATITYVCQESSADVYVIVKIDTTSGLDVTFATITNNPTVTNYADALSGRATLTYNTYGTAF